MVRLADGDRAALPRLVDDLWPIILSFVRRGLRDGPDAEDVAQEVFIRLCGRIDQLDRGRDGVAWAFGIASYEVMSQRRRVYRRREVPGDLASDRDASDDESQEDHLLRAEVALAFSAAVGALTDDDRRALGLTDDGDAAGVAGPTLRKRRQRALERLRDIWRSGYGRP